jgi:hypothetical protein
MDVPSLPINGNAAVFSSDLLLSPAPPPSEAISRDAKEYFLLQNNSNPRLSPPRWHLCRLEPPAREYRLNPWTITNGPEAVDILPK